MKGQFKEEALKRTELMLDLLLILQKGQEVGEKNLLIIKPKAEGTLVRKMSFACFVQLLLLLVTQPLPRDGGMAEDHGAPEAGQLPSVWVRGHKETKSRQRVSGTKSP